MTHRTSPATLDELRETLDSGAGDLHPGDDVSRVVAVHERIRVVRRRRRAAAGVTIAAVLAAVVGVGVTVDPDRPAGLEPAGPPAVVAGQRIPDRVTVLGLEYGYAEALPVDLEAERGKVVLRLPAGDADRAVALAGTGLEGGSLTLRQGGDGSGLARLVGDGLDQPLPLGASRQELVVRPHDVGDLAEAALVVYERTGTAPAGVSEGGSYFRSSVAGEDLVSADFSEPGASSLELAVSARRGATRAATHCRTDARRVWVHLDVDGRTVWSRSCGDVEGDGTWGSDGSTTRRAGQHTFRLWTSLGSGGAEQAVPGTVLGLGVYRQGEQGPRVLGRRVDLFQEAAGRLWRLEDAVPMPVRGAAVLVDTRDEPALLGLVMGRGGLQLSARGSYGPTERFDGFSNRASSAVLGGFFPLLPGDQYAVGIDRLLGSERLPERARLLVYRPVS